MDKYLWINMHTSVYHITHREGEGVAGWSGDLLVPRLTPVLESQSYSTLTTLKSLYILVH
jgi:hypothetical protein